MAVLLPVKTTLLRLLLFITIFTILFDHFEASDNRPNKRDYNKHYYYAVELEENSRISPRDVADLLKVRYVGPIGELDNYYLYSSSKELVHLVTRSLGSIDLSDES